MFIRSQIETLEGFINEGRRFSGYNGIASGRKNNIDRYIYFGGYPGSAPLIDDEDRWKNYIKDSLIETSISKDILMLTRVDKPALLKRLFEVGSLCSVQMYWRKTGKLLQLKSKAEKN
jgi:predicted AAA+ superfamily ATPase